MSENTVASRPRGGSAGFVLTTLGLDALGVGIIAPIVPGLVQQLEHLPPEQAAPWVGALVAAYAGVQFFAAPLLGALSDRFGRRPVILASVFGIGLSQAVTEGFLLTRITARLGNRRTALLGYTAAALGYATLALALAGWMLAPAARCWRECCSGGFDPA